MSRSYETIVAGFLTYIRIRVGLEDKTLALNDAQRMLLRRKTVTQGVISDCETGLLVSLSDQRAIVGRPHYVTRNRPPC
jgi:hypothetical protein